MNENLNQKGVDPLKLAALVTAPISIISAIATPDAALAIAAQAEQDNQEQQLDFLADNTGTVGSIGSLPNNQSIHIVAAGETLGSIAAQHGISAGELQRINDLSDSTLLLPGQALKLFSQVVQPSVLDKIVTPLEHTVKSGETLGKIAQHYSISLSGLLALNKLSEKALIFPGQKLQIRSVTPSKPQRGLNALEHVVTEGETLIDIAKSNRVSLTALLKLNNLSKTSLIFVGQKLELPRPAAEQVASPAVATNSIGKPTVVCLFHGFHKIRAGETISKIAAMHGVSTQSLLTANQLNWNSTIFIGQKIMIPGVHSALDCPKLTPLSDEMTQNAELIIQIGRLLGVGDYGIVIALATAMQESSLRNIAFGDRDSVGLFQQRPSAHWGTKELIMDPNHSIRAFFGGESSPTSGVARGLLDIKNWKKLPLTEAAQAVQVSAHPQAYAKWEPSAWKWLIELDQLEDS